MECPPGIVRDGRWTAAFPGITSLASSTTAPLTGSALGTGGQPVRLNYVKAYIPSHTKQQSQTRLFCSKKRLTCTKAERHAESRKWYIPVHFFIQLLNTNLKTVADSMPIKERMQFALMATMERGCADSRYM